MRRPYSKPRDAYDASAGLTFVELLIALAVSAGLFAAIAQVLITQQAGYTRRQRVVAMQQQGRDGLDILAQELAMAGFDPTGTSGASIVTATASTLRFTQDLNGMNGIEPANGEDVSYQLSDVDGDGDADLARMVNGVTQMVASNIETLAYIYTLVDGTTTDAPADLSQIRSIGITLTARTARPDPQYTVHDGYRTQQQRVTVQVRNLGL